MGQGYSLTTLSAGSAGIDVPELADLSYVNSLGTARFMKTIRARHRGGLVVVKVVVKPYPSLKLDKYVKAILRERKILANIANAQGYQRVLETSTNGYLVRQYLYSSLYDRMSTRPFLEHIEKKWLAFQLLSGLRDCHAQDVFHGDIKTENTLVTSWNWLYLSDFSSSFKPTYLPEDNPADFSYYFDTSGRRTCYLAPERFLLAGEQAEGKEKIKWAMDVFSAGCVIAELFLESPIFSLSQLFKYRKNEYDPMDQVRRIEDKGVQDLISHMICLDPDNRLNAQDCLIAARQNAFPEYFYSFLHQYMGSITDPSLGRSPITADSINLGEADDRIDKIYYDFDKISYFLGYENETAELAKPQQNTLLVNNIIPVYLDIPNNSHQTSNVGNHPADDGSLIFLTLIVSSIRSTARSTARLRACDILLAFAERVSDEAKLDRILPYVITILEDKAEIVQVAAIRTLAQLLALVNVVPPINAHIFPEYVLPRLNHLIFGPKSDPSPFVRATYASCLASLALTASRYLDMVQALRADGSLPNADPEAEDGYATDFAYQTLFDVARSDLVEYFETHTKALLTDPESSVRRAFLGSVSSLCVFFGTAKANDVILSHLNTYLNDKDWMLKCAFFETIVGVATFVGGTSLEEFILPLMVQALIDPEEFVVESVIRSLASMAALGLFQRLKTWELIDIVARFTIHPNIWIREAAAAFISSTTAYLSVADIHCIIEPLVLPYMKSPISSYTEIKLLDSLKRPLARPAFDMAISWAIRVEKGIFWKSVQLDRTFNFGSTDESTRALFTKNLRKGALNKIPKNDEDEQWLSRLRNIGMGTDDEWKLLALRDYIWCMAHSKPKDSMGNNNSHVGTITKLSGLNIKPQIIFFDDKQNVFDQTRLEEAQATLDKKPLTINDALLDASMTIDDSLAKRKRSAINSRRARAGNHTPSIPVNTGSAGSRRATSQSPSPSNLQPAGVLETADSSVTASDLESRDVPINSAKVPEGTSSSPSSRSGADGKLQINRIPVRRKGSAVNLIGRQDNTKGLPETSTTSANAFGKVEGPFARALTQKSPLAMASELGSKPEAPFQFRAAHNYKGNDPNVLKLLDSLYLENYPTDIVEFGPLVAPFNRVEAANKNNAELPDKPWRPNGGLVQMFAEHTGPVNRVVVAPDHTFFITASDDGTVRVWDTARLERNVVHRSRQTHRHTPGAKVKSICFVQNTHCFVSTATDGSIHVMKVDLIRGTNSVKYGKLKLMREYQLPESEHGVWTEHFKSESNSVLLVATNKSRILALDLRPMTMTVLYVLNNPIHHGTPTCLCIDRKYAWLVLGTSHGILDLWDLRFRVRLKAWGLPGSTPIHRVCTHPVKDRNKWVCVAGGSGGSEITVWDIEKTQCREVYRTGATRDPPNGYEPWLVNELRPEGMLSRFATSLEPQGSSTVDRGMRALAVGLNWLDEARDSRHAFFVTGGSDRKIRFWDLVHTDASTVVSGLDTEEAKPIFTTSYPASGLAITAERVPQPGPTAPNAASSGKSHVASKRGGGRLPRSTVISLQQQNLLKTHLDTVLDVAILESPFGMTVSVDRSGAVYVFQ
ncbi:MAG: Serine/threonine-protein kinase [Trizodia sp. TS-e1964]|nr:MAG: Serine/threonine-protein kinase [Trizodia sp. TS-e1964]